MGVYPESNTSYLNALVLKYRYWHEPQFSSICKINSLRQGVKGMMKRSAVADLKNPKTSML